MLVILGILLALGIFLASSGIVMLVWNILAHYFHFQTISFVIAMVINIGLAIVGGYFRSSK